MATYTPQAWAKRWLELEDSITKADADLAQAKSKFQELRDQRSAVEINLMDLVGQNIHTKTFVVDDKVVIVRHGYGVSAHPKE